MDFMLITHALIQQSGAETDAWLSELSVGEFNENKLKEAVSQENLTPLHQDC